MVAVLLGILVVACIGLLVCSIHWKKKSRDHYVKSLTLARKYDKLAEKVGRNATQADFESFFCCEDVLNNKEEAARLTRVYKNTFNNHKYDYWETYKRIYESYEDTIARVDMLNREFKNVFGEDTITAEKFIAPLGLMKAAITQDVVKVGNSIVGRVHIELRDIVDRVEDCNDAVVSLMQRFIELSLIDQDRYYFIKEVELLTRELKYYKNESE